MKIESFLGRLLNIRSGEWSRLLLLYSMSLVVLTGCTWADAIVQAAFLQRVGVQYLPWVFISCAAFSFGAMFVYSAFADRVSNTRLLIALLAISGAGILLGLAALAGGLVGLGYLLLFLVLQVPLLDLYNVHWATYVNGFYDIRTAKRIVPVLSTTARFAGIIGGLSMPLMNRLLSPAAILIVAVGSLHTSWFLPAAMLILGLAFALAALMVRRHYGQALVDLLEQEDYSSLALQAPSPLEPSTLAAADPVTLARLAQKLGESTSPERAIFMAQLIIAAGGEAAVPIVGQAARAATDSRLAASLVDVLVAADLRRGGVRELFAELLTSGDGQVRLSAIGGLEQIDGPRDGRYLEVAARLLADPEIEIRLRVLPALVAADDPGWHAAGINELRALLNAPDPYIRARALGVVRQARASGFLPEVVRSFTEEADEVRLAAALAVEGLVDDESSSGNREALLAPVLALLHDPIERARVAAITILGRLSKDSGPDAAAVRERLVEGLGDPSPEVRERAVEVLASAGRRAVPQVYEQLNSGDPHLRKMAAVVLARIEPRKYASLVRGPILNNNLFTIYRNLSLLQALAGCANPAVAVLARALRERNASQLDEVFYLLATIQDPAAIKTIAHSLRSPQPEVRANATEALESLTAPQTAALVGPLFEPDGSRPSGPLLSLAKQTWDISVPTPTAAMRLLLSDENDAWQRTLAAAALAELSRSADPVSSAEIAELLSLTQTDPDVGVRTEVSVTAAGPDITSVNGKGARQARALSLVEKLILLQEVPFFQGMFIDQLKVLASVCEEERFPEGALIFEQGDIGGAFYLVVSGRVGIEQEKRKGSCARLATVEARSYLGETDFFDNNVRMHSAMAIQDTLTLRLRREPLIALARQHPDMSLELINVLSARLREANDRISDLARTRPRELHKLFDHFT